MRFKLRTLFLVPMLVMGSMFSYDCCDKMLDLLAQSQADRDFSSLSKPIAEGLELPQPKGLFPRLEMPEDAA